MKGEGWVRLHANVRGDWPYDRTIAPAGDYEAHANSHGAVSVVALNGHLLGVKPDEFVWIETPKPGIRADG